MPFSSDLREKLLLWCDRRCCLCKRACDVFIEIHHIVPEKDGGKDDEDNAIPLCFDCHAKVSHYDHSQPMGTKFKPNELKRRREQVYDEYTRHLVPALSYNVHPNGRTLPQVGFSIQHLGHAPQIQALVTLDSYVNGELASDQHSYALYRGGLRWNLNPMEGVNGQFDVPQAAMDQDADVRVGVKIIMHDVYERPHKLLPVTYVLLPDRRGWFLDPINPEDSARQARRIASRKGRRK